LAAPLEIQRISCLLLRIAEKRLQLIITFNFSYIHCPYTLDLFAGEYKHRSISRINKFLAQSGDARYVPMGLFALPLPCTNTVLGRSMLLASAQENIPSAKVLHEIRVLQRRLRSRTFTRGILIEINDELPIDFIQ
jgi:hypothetical protein